MQTDTLAATYTAAAQTDRGRDRVARLADALADVATLHRGLARVGMPLDHADAAEALAALADTLADAARDATTPDATGPTVTVRHLAEGEVIADPASTRRTITGPCTVRLTRWPDGGTDAVVTEG